MLVQCTHPSGSCTWCIKISARALFCLNSPAKVNTQLLIYNCMMTNKNSFDLLNDKESKTLKRYDFVWFFFSHILKILYSFITMTSFMHLTIQVFAIRSSLSHMKLIGKLNISDQTLSSNFKDIINLIDCLYSLHPNHFTTSISAIKSKLNDVSILKAYFHIDIKCRSCWFTF